VANLRIFLVRHGQTTWNTEDRFQGHADVPLDSTGERQVTMLANRLANLPFKAIYSSDLQRASQTAQVIATVQDSPVILDPRFREIHFGLWQGMTTQIASEKYPTQLSSWNDNRLSYIPPGGESFFQLADRVASGMQHILSLYSSDDILLVSHGVSLRALTCQLLEIGLENYWRFQFSNASLSEIQISSRGASLNLLNDTSHLANDN